MKLLRQRHDDLENQLNRGALWAVTYGDLMSYLMIFFLIMFAFSLPNVKKERGGNREYEQSLAAIQKTFGGEDDPAIAARYVQREREEMAATRIRQAIDDSPLAQHAKVEAAPERVKLVLANAVLFDSGSAELKPQAEALLAAIVETLRTLPNAVVVEGHTDNVPIRGGRFGSNWELSMARAYSVVRFFEQAGIEPRRLSGIGYGEHRPVADNAVPAERNKNRRIEIAVLRD